MRSFICGIALAVGTLAFTSLAHAQLTSAFPSTVAGISIGNTHELSAGVLRGSEPRTKVSELLAYGVSDVIIFKNQTKKEVEEELKVLKEVGITSHHIDFRWKGLESPQVACEQLMEALSIIKKVKKDGGSVFFHCTVGEDRTGILAGLYQMTSNRMSMKEAYKEEMCARGYADGNKKKPWAVSKAIHDELTPIFVALAKKLEKGEKLTKASCKNLAVTPVKMSCKSIN